MMYHDMRGAAAFASIFTTALVMLPVLGIVYLQEANVTDSILENLSLDYTNETVENITFEENLSTTEFVNLTEYLPINESTIPEDNFTEENITIVEGPESEIIITDAEPIIPIIEISQSTITEILSESSVSEDETYITWRRIIDIKGSSIFDPQMPYDYYDMTISGLSEESSFDEVVFNIVGDCLLEITYKTPPDVEWRDEITLSYSGIETKVSARIKDNNGNRNDVALVNSLKKSKAGDEALDSVRSRIFGEKKKFKEIDVENPIVSVKSVLFKGVDSDGTLELGIEDIPFDGAVKSYAIDPSRMLFDNATVTATAAGNSLYKCPSWDFFLRQCVNEDWMFVASITPGVDYSFALSATDPAYVEFNESETQATSTSTSFVNVVMEIPYDEAVPMSIANKTPAVLIYPNATASIRMRKLAGKIVGKRINLPEGFIARILRFIFG